MDSLWVCYEQLGYCVILISCDWIIHFVPQFFGRWGNCATIGQKFDDAFIWRVVVTKQLNMGKQKTETVWLHFGEKYASLPILIFEEPWLMRWGYRVDYPLLWSIMQ